MITVFGLGFVGLTTAVGFADKGYKVFGIDKDEDRKNILKAGRIPFAEIGLDKALERNLNKRFFVCENTNQAIKESEYIFFCVGTPYGENGQADLKYLYSAVEDAINTVKSLNDDRFRILIIKSTIPPSTTKEKIFKFIESHGLKVGEDIGLANNPEFLREGFCWEDFMNPDRIVIGTEEDRTKHMLEDLYKPFNAPVFTVNYNTGEFIKYLSNTLLATLISYSNEMSLIADKIGEIDVAKSFRILHMDKRLNGSKIASYIYPGCGYGGYCLPKDTSAIYALVKNKGFDPMILKNVMDTNEKMSEFICKKISEKAGKKDKIGILGLSFKPNSDDVRDTPAAKIIRELKNSGYENIYAYDPIAISEFKKYYPDVKINYVELYDEIIDKCDIFVIVTAWDEFKNIRNLTDKPVIDGRYML